MTTAEGFGNALDSGTKANRIGGPVERAPGLSSCTSPDRNGFSAIRAPGRGTPVGGRGSRRLVRPFLPAQPGYEPGRANPRGPLSRLLFRAGLPDEPGERGGAGSEGPGDSPGPARAGRAADRRRGRPKIPFVRSRIEVPRLGVAAHARPVASRPERPIINGTSGRRTLTAQVLKRSTAFSGEARMSRISTKALLAALVSLALALPLSAQCGDFQWQNPTPQGNRLAGAAYGHGTFVAVGAAGTILTSSDGAAWMARVSNTRADLESVAFNGSLFVAVGAGGSALTSPDGVLWTAHGVGTASTLRRVSWSGSQFAAVGDAGAVATSPNGSVWTPRASGTSKALSDVAWNGSRFVAVGEIGALLVSPDGVSWTAASYDTRDTLSSVAWNGSQFVVSSTGFVATAGILRSSDGMNWTGDSIGLAPPMRFIQWTGAAFVGVGESGAGVRG